MNDVKQLRIDSIAKRLLVALASGGCLSSIGWCDMPPPVVVQSKQEGHGFLMTRLGSCFTVTVAHVLDGSSHAKLYGLGERVLEGRGERVAVDEAADIAILRVSGPLAGRCGLDHVSGTDLSRLRSDASALIVNTDPAGGVRRAQFKVVDVMDQLIRIRPDVAGDGVMQGYSGSLVDVAGSPAGMVVSVPNLDEAGSAWARRYDDLMARVRRMLDKMPVASSISSTAAGPAGVPLTSGARATVTSWRPSPTLAEHHAGRLVEAGTSEYWEVQLQGGQAEVVVELPGERVQSVSRVTVGRHGLPAASAPPSLELFVSADGASWVSVALLDFAGNTELTTADFMPRRARYARLRVYGSSEHDDRVVAISRLFVR